MSMSFTFLHNSTHNTTIVDTATNSILFEVSTPSGSKKRITTVANSRGEVVGTYDRNRGSELVTIRGETVNRETRGLVT